MRNLSSRTLRILSLRTMSLTRYVYAVNTGSLSRRILSKPLNGTQAPNRKPIRETRLICSLFQSENTLLYVITNVYRSILHSGYHTYSSKEQNAVGSY